MTTRVIPADKIAAYLRQSLTDYNSSSRANTYWIYSGWPELEEMIRDKNNFPMVSVDTLPESTQMLLAMDSSEMYEKVRFLISVWSVRRLVCDVVSTSEEQHTFATGTDDYALTNTPPTSVTTITGTLSGTPDHEFVQDTDYSLVDSDSDMHLDTIRWDTGEDIPDDTTTFKVTYKESKEGRALVDHISQDINVALQDNWRTATLLSGMYNYWKVRSQPILLDEDIGIFRHELEITFEMINPGR